jgi:NAD(P)-dependent dehydrogenase (short-subunit alcohol dehydrogenase family)
MSDSLFDLSGRVALVTGTSRGLGQYFARALARAGADIAITSRDKESLSVFADEIRALGRQTFRSSSTSATTAASRALSPPSKHTSVISISWSTTLAAISANLP